MVSIVFFLFGATIKCLFSFLNTCVEFLCEELIKVWHVYSCYSKPANIDRSLSLCRHRTSISSIIYNGSRHICNKDRSKFLG